MDKEKLLKFIQDHEDDIEENNWAAIFDDIEYNCDYLNYFVAFLDEQHIDYLPYIERIYWYMYAEMGNRHGRQSFTIPSGIVDIEDRAFMDNSQLTEVYIPKSVEHIGEYVFEGCAQGKVLHTTYEGSDWDWEKKVYKNPAWRSGTKVKITFENK